jgi:hypothetical protein
VQLILSYDIATSLCTLSLFSGLVSKIIPQISNTTYEVDIWNMETRSNYDVGSGLAARFDEQIAWLWPAEQTAPVSKVALTTQSMPGED